MRTIACEGYCPFLLLHFLVFVDNKMYICKRSATRSRTEYLKIQND